MLGVSACYGREEWEDDNIPVKGLSVDFKVPFGERFQLMGEANGGEALRVSGAGLAPF